MRKKQVWRYYCEFCKKSGCSGGHMKRHELTCTANPTRKCRMCSGNPGRGRYLPSEVDTASLVAILLRPGTMPEDWKAKMIQLREAADHCPACILAAIRQSKVQVCDSGDPNPNQDYAFDMSWDGHTLGFDFKAEKGSYLREKNDTDAAYY